MQDVFLVSGGNVGNTQLLLEEANRLLALRCGTIHQLSRFFQSKSWGFDAEQLFINQAIHLRTALDPLRLLHEVLAIERELGRVRSADSTYTSRSIDIDIIAFGSEIIDNPELVVPHPRMHLRNFVLFPLADLDSIWVHPILSLNIEQLRLKCVDTSEVEALI